MIDEISRISLSFFKGKKGTEFELVKPLLCAIDVELLESLWKLEAVSQFYEMIILMWTAILKLDAIMQIYSTLNNQSLGSSLSSRGARNSLFSSGSDPVCLSGNLLKREKKTWSVLVKLSIWDNNNNIEKNHPNHMWQNLSKSLVLRGPGLDFEGKSEISILRPSVQDMSWQKKNARVCTENRLRWGFYKREFSVQILSSDFEC